MLGIMKKDWDVAIILDACRYDFFERIYEDYFNGNLEGVEGANETIEWLYKNFPKEHYGIDFFSSHPAINSLGFEWGKFTAKKKFDRVYDCWKSGWDEEIGTTRPEATTDYVLKNIRKKRTIIHYMQPHAPYRKGKKSMIPKAKRGIIGTYIDKSPEIIRKTYWKTRFAFGFEDPMTTYFRKRYPEDKIRWFYADNLLWVLKEVKRLVESKEMEGRKIIITADHGELLGEDGLWFHPPFSEHPIIKKVPLLRLLTKRG